ncbi:MAG: reverse transcriptase domain-containing protein, partial [Fusobacteriaceae bacterium]
NENVKNKTTMKEQLSLLKFKTFGHLELVRNSIITSKFTNFSKVRYEKDRNNTSKKIQPIERFVSFATENVIKKNGKKKVRFFCKPYNTYKKMFRELKDIITDCVTLDEAMLGAGTGLIASKDYFEDFDALVKIDFKDFFNQVSYGKFLTGLKAECVEFISEEAMKSVAMNICPYSTEKKKRATYQGLPTSTIASYIALKPLFLEIKKELAKYNTSPVIYIDDLCFKAKDKKEAFELKKNVLDIIKKFKFVVNKEKCKVLYGNKCFFLGINMRTKSMPKKYVDTVKAGLNNYFHGTEEFRETIKPVIKGRLEYIKYINEEQFVKLKEHHKYGMFISDLYER